MPPNDGPALPVADAVRAAVAEHAGRPGPLLLVLQSVQARLGHLPPEAARQVAVALNLSRAEVHGVVSFYHDFRDTPPGRTVLRICRAESCQAVGADALVDHLTETLGIGWHQTTDDGALTLEPVYCLGQCALSPALMAGTEVHGRVTTERLDTLVATLRSAP